MFISPVQPLPSGLDEFVPAVAVQQPPTWEGGRWRVWGSIPRPPPPPHCTGESQQEAQWDQEQGKVSAYHLHIHMSMLSIYCLEPRYPHVLSLAQRFSQFLPNSESTGPITPILSLPSKLHQFWAYQVNNIILPYDETFCTEFHNVKILLIRELKKTDFLFIL